MLRLVSPGRYALAPIPYFVFVRHPGVRRIGRRDQGNNRERSGAGLSQTSRGSRAPSSLPLILNPSGPTGARTVDFSNMSSVRAVVGADLTPAEKVERHSPKRLVRSDCRAAPSLVLVLVMVVVVVVVHQRVALALIVCVGRCVCGRMLAQVIQRVQRAMNLALTMTKAFNLQSADESLAL